MKKEATFALFLFCVAGCGSGDGEPEDTLAPGWQSGSSLTAVDVGPTGLRLQWTSAEDDTGVTGYRVHQDGVQTGSTGGEIRELVVTGLLPDTEYTFQVQAGDAAGNWSEDGPSTTVRTAQDLPPDPVDVAPVLDRSAVTGLHEAVGFIYTGDDAIQKGMDPETIEARRVAVLRGMVLGQDGEPLPGVTVDVLGHPEYGWTVSRADGAYDLVVNGGGHLTLRYRLSGLLPAQRKLRVPFRDYTWLPEVVMVPPDDQVTAIDLSAASGIQVARGGAVTDGDGSRQATLLVPEGVGASLKLPGGGSQDLSGMSIRATEFTVGDDGPRRMPARLPPASFYTYAVDLGVDEAAAAGASGVDLDGEVYFYVENFLGFLVSSPVPMGTYDEERGVWVPSASGLVIGIVAVEGGTADIDVDGDGQADQGTALSDLGITDEERAELGATYAAGTSLWRVGIDHFTVWDCNWAVSPPDDAVVPDVAPRPDDGDSGCEEEGWVIDAHNQVLGEDVALAGLPFGLHYRSDRVPGRKSKFDLKIPLRGPDEPESLKGIELDIRVAGQRHELTFGADPDPGTDWDHHTFSWNGLDAYMRPVQGSVPVEVQMGYTYDAVYQQTDRFGDSGDDVMITGNQARDELTLWRLWQGRLGIWEARPQGLGGWSLSIHHAYDPDGRVLYLGDGRRRSTDGMPPVISTAAGDGGGLAADDFEDRLATAVPIGSPRAVAVDPEGRLAFTTGAYLLRVEHDGRLTVLAGGGLCCDMPDGVPALGAYLDTCEGIDFGQDGSIYLTHTTEHRIWRITPDGTLHVFAGTGESGYGGDDGPATEAQLYRPTAAVAAPDGNVYIADWGNKIVRKVSPDGRIDVFAGTPGEAGSPFGENGDGGPATDALLSSSVEDLAVGPDGSVYIADGTVNRVRRVTPGGIIATVAGNGDHGHPDQLGDGGPAVEAELDHPYGIDVGPDGSLTIACGDHRVRHVGPDGIITTLAGDGESGFLGDEGPARAGQIYQPNGLALGPEGEVYISDYFNYRVREVAHALKGFSDSADIVIPSEDGGEIYVFNSAGKHLSSQHPLTGAILYDFTYDEAGRLASIEDADGKVTTIEHDAQGHPTTIRPPFAPPTQLTVDADGYLDSITDPAGNLHQFTYGSGGLMESMTDPEGGLYEFTYDTKGRLTLDEDPAGGHKALDRTEEGISDGHAVSVTTALDRETLYRTERLATGDRLLTTVFPSLKATRLYRNEDGTRLLRYADGTEIHVTQAPDVRWGMLSPYAGETTLTTPGGVTYESQTERTMLAPEDAGPMDFTQILDQVTVNGRTYNRGFTRATREWELQTPEGRETRIVLDGNGRPVSSDIVSSQIHPVEYTYDEHGRLSVVSQGTGADERSQVLTYDGNGFLESVTDPMDRTVFFARDDAGRIVTQTLPDGRQIGFSYDQNGNLTTVTPPGRPDHLMDHTPVDLMASYDPPDVTGVSPDTTTYEYDLDRKLTRILRPGGEEITLGYDFAGRMDAVNGPDWQIGIGYDPDSGHVSTIATSDMISQEYTYDGHLLTHELWQGSFLATIDRTYNNDLRLESLTCSPGAAIHYGYDLDGLLTSAGDITLIRDEYTGMTTGTVLGNVTTTTTYNNFGEPDTYTANHNATQLFDVSYVRDKLGRITEKTETIEGATSHYEYTYDEAGRLTEVIRDTITISIYTYDENSNRLTHTNESDTTTATYDDQDRLLTYGDATYTYTPNGELLTKTDGAETTTYDYDTFGNLRSVAISPGGPTITYRIDPRNRRIGKEVNGTLVQSFIYADQLNPIAELDGNGDLVSLFIYASRSNVPDYMVRGGVLYRIISDHLGSPRLVVNTSNGTIEQSMDYDEFGRVLQDTNPGFQPFGFAGGLYCTENGLLRYGARDLDPIAGRWLQKDPIVFLGGTSNLYEYVLNNPINFLDIDGLKFEIDWITVMRGLESSGFSGLALLKMVGSRAFGWAGFIIGVYAVLDELFDISGMLGDMLLACEEARNDWTDDLADRIDQHGPLMDLEDHAVEERRKRDLAEPINFLPFPEPPMWKSQ